MVVLALVLVVAVVLLTGAAALGVVYTFAPEVLPAWRAEVIGGGAPKARKWTKSRKARRQRSTVVRRASDDDAGDAADAESDAEPDTHMSKASKGSAGSTSSSGARRRGGASRGSKTSDISGPDSPGRNKSVAKFAGAMRGVGGVLAAGGGALAARGSIAAENMRNLAVDNMPARASPSKRPSGSHPHRQTAPSDDYFGEPDDDEHGSGQAQRESSASRWSLRRGKAHPARGHERFQRQLNEHPMLESSLKPHDITTAVAFSPNGQYIATAGTGGAGGAGGAQDEGIRLTVRTTIGHGEDLMRTIPVELPVDDWVSSLAFSRDGFFLVAGTGSKGLVVVLRVFRRVSAKPMVEKVFETGHSAPIRHVYMANAPGSEAYHLTTAASEGDCTVRFWSSAKKPKLLYQHDMADEGFVSIVQARFSASGKVMAVSGAAQASDGDANVAFFNVTFGNRGGVGKKVWTVHSLERVDVPEQSAFAKAVDIDYGQRSAVLAVAAGADWRIVRVKDKRVSNLAKFKAAAGEPDFDAIAVSELQRSVIASKGGALYFFRIPQSASMQPELEEVIEAASDSTILRILVSPEEDAIITIGANSQAARLWKLSSVI